MNTKQSFKGPKDAEWGMAFDYVDMPGFYEAYTAIFRYKSEDKAHQVVAKQGGSAYVVRKIGDGIWVKA